MYTIIGRIKEGTVVVGYVLRDNASGETSFFERNAVYKMAMNKEISDVTVQIYNNKVNMKGTKCAISSLPCYDRNGNLIEKANDSKEPKQYMFLNGRVMDGKSVIAYRIAVVENGKIVKQGIFDRKRVFDIARTGVITNVRYQQCNGVGILRGLNCKLSNLPVVKV